MNSSTNDFGDGVEKRADWLLKDIRQMNSATATLNGGSLRLDNNKKRTRSQLENKAVAETALISINPTRVSADLKYEMSRQYNKGRAGRNDVGWNDDGLDSHANNRYNDNNDNTDNEFSSDTTRSPNSVSDENNNSINAGPLSSSLTGTLSGHGKDRGLTQSMRLNPDPGGFREKYLQTFDGLQGYSKEGITKLDFLVKCAVEALGNSKVPNKSGYRFGSSVMTKSDQIFTACNIESSVDALASSAERTAILKAATEGHSDFMGLVIASDSDNVDHILPDGTSRQFLAEFGDFEVYVVTANGKRHQYTTYELFPSAGRRVPASPMKTR